MKLIMENWRKHMREEVSKDVLGKISSAFDDDELESVEAVLDSDDPPPEDALEERTLTPEEEKKKKKVAKAIKKDNPSMPMDKKMAIATKVAKETA